jgi:non-specific serine/threonine protein kinase
VPEILSATRLVTLTGFGGAGKSRLAHEIARGALATYRGGVFWIDLADAHDDAHVVSPPSRPRSA